jgi:hypothetical protein
LPRDLEAITLHCLEKDPARRYPSALALAEDLQRFREGKQVTARPVGAVARLARWCRRRPLVALLLALLTVSLLGGLGGVTWQWREANDQRDLANARARQADDEKKAAQYQTYRASLAAATAALEIHDVADAARHLKLSPQALQGWEWRHLRNRLDDSSSVVPLPAGGVAFLIADQDRFQVGALTSAGLRITDLESGVQRTLPLSAERRRYVSVAQTRRGLRVAAWVDDTALDLLDDGGQVPCRVRSEPETGPGPVAVSPDGRWLASGGWDRTVRLWDAATGEPRAALPHPSFVGDLAFGPDGTWLVTGCLTDNRLRIWDVATARFRKEIPTSDKYIRSLAVSLDGTKVAATTYDDSLKIRLTVFDIASGKSIFSARLRGTPRGRGPGARGQTAGWSSSCGARRRTRPRSWRHSGPTGS